VSGAPLFGALLIGATYIAGSRYGKRVGVAAAAIVVSTPAFLHQFAQPTTDLAAAALWLTAVAGVTAVRPMGAVVGGIAAAAAIAIGPNLVPLVIPLGLFLLLRPERLWHERMGAAARFAGTAAAGLVCAVLIQAGFSGPPFTSPYGSIGALLDTHNVAPNVTRYASWLSETLTPGWVLAAGAPFLLPGALTRLFLWMFLVNVACSLPFVVADDRSYLRFLLPTIPLVVGLGVAVIDSLCRRTWSWTSRPVLFAVAIAMAIFGSDM
jgi:hypothetical protein